VEFFYRDFRTFFKEVSREFFSFSELIKRMYIGVIKKSCCFYALFSGFAENRYGAGSAAGMQ